MTTAFAGERVRSARLLFGLTQHDLARAGGVSQSLISYVEKGQKEATDDLLDSIAHALSTPRSFFDVIPEAIPLDSLRFRKNSTASQRDTRRATTLFSEAYRVAVRLVAEVGYHTPSLPQPRGEIGEDAIEDLAKETRAALRVSLDAPIPHVTRALERAGITVAPIVLPDLEPIEDAVLPGHFGLSYWAGPGEGALIGFFPGSKPDRDRFTLAHEVGHIVLHTHRSSADPEGEANRFASAFLLPRDRAVEVFDRRLVLSDFARLKAIWGMSIQAIIMRGGHLGFIGPDRKRSLFTQLTARGWRRDEPVIVHPEEPMLFWRLLSARFGQSPYQRAVDALAIPAVILRSLAPPPTRRDNQRRDASVHQILRH